MRFSIINITCSHLNEFCFHIFILYLLEDNYHTHTFWCGMLGRLDFFDLQLLHSNSECLGICGNMWKQNQSWVQLFHGPGYGCIVCQNVYDWVRSLGNAATRWSIESPALVDVTPKDDSNNTDPGWRWVRWSSGRRLAAWCLMHSFWNPKNLLCWVDKSVMCSFHNGKSANDGNPVP